MSTYFIQNKDQDGNVYYVASDISRIIFDEHVEKYFVLGNSYGGKVLCRTLCGNKDKSDFFELMDPNDSTITWMLLNAVKI